MKRLLLLAGLWPALLFGQLTPEEPMPDPDKPAEKADLYKHFKKISLPLEAQLTSEAQAAKIIEDKKLPYLMNDLMTQFFPIPYISAPDGPKPLLIYPYGYAEIGADIRAYICLEDWGDGAWQMRAYTIKSETQFISALTLAQSPAMEKGAIKSTFKADWSVLFTEQTDAKVPNVNGEQIISGFRSQSTQCAADGKFAPLKEGEFKGIQLYPTPTSLPDEIYAEGTTLKTNHWRDALGEHIAIISFVADGGDASLRTDAPLSLRFYHYFKKAGEKQFSILHQSVTTTKACALDVADLFHSEGMLLSDVDKNNTLEVFIPYWSDCPKSDFATLNLRLLAWEGPRENFQNIIVPNKGGGAPQYTFTSPWMRLPESVRKQADAIIKAMKP